MRKYWPYYFLAVSVILLDQATKLWVYRNMTLWGPTIPILGKWIYLEYVLNPGMAFGLQIPIPSQYGKLLLTALRIGAVTWMARYIPRLARHPQGSLLTLTSWGLILGGAIGNVIDSVFYGVFLHNTPPDAPMSWFYGQVIDMVRVGIHHIHLPSWLPVWGGHYLPAFPVFNVADMAISTGVGFMLLDMVLQGYQVSRRAKQQRAAAATTIG